MKSLALAKSLVTAEGLLDIPFIVIFNKVRETARARTRILNLDTIYTVRVVENCLLLYFSTLEALRHRTRYVGIDPIHPGLTSA